MRQCLAWPSPFHNHASYLIADMSFLYIQLQIIKLSRQGDILSQSYRQSPMLNIHADIEHEVLPS